MTSAMLKPQKNKKSTRNHGIAGLDDPKIEPAYREHEAAYRKANGIPADAPLNNNARSKIYRAHVAALK